MGAGREQILLLRERDLLAIAATVSSSAVACDRIRTVCRQSTFSTVVSGVSR
jgi:hypothetical protein